MPPMTAQQQKHLRSLIRELLLSSECQKINFDFAYSHGFSHGYGYNRHKVDGWGFAYIALCLDTPLNSGRGISVGLRNQTSQGIGASYDSASDRIEVPSVVFGHTTDQRRSLVHECTHALRDAYGLKGRINGAAGVPLPVPRGVEEEAEAYIAAALYVIYEAKAEGLTLATPNGPVFAAAHAIAMNIADTPGALVGVGDHAPLRQAILAHPVYDNIMHGNMDFVYSPPPNGIRL